MMLVPKIVFVEKTLEKLTAMSMIRFLLFYCLLCW